MAIWLFAPLLLCLGTGADGSAYLAGPCADAPARIRVAPEGEPGTPLVVRGHVFRPDGTTPAAGVVLYVHQTDLTGLYHRPGERAPRLRGWLRTDAQGAYEYRTIRPAPYPGNTIAAHIHTQLWGAGVPPQYGTDLLFDDDPLVSQDERRRSEALGRFAFVKLPTDQGGTPVVTHDLRLSTEGSRFEQVTMHGLRECE